MEIFDFTKSNIYILLKQTSWVDKMKLKEKLRAVFSYFVSDQSLFFPREANR